MGISVKVGWPVRTGQPKLIGNKAMGTTTKGIRIAVLDHLYSEAQYLKTILEGTTLWWEGLQPHWKIGKKGFGAGGYSVSVTANPETDFGAQKWAWLDQGTLGKPRWSMMRRGFIPKTSAAPQNLDVLGHVNPRGRSGTSYNPIKSYKGANSKPAFVGMTAFAVRNLPPNPGIEPRNWTKFIEGSLSGKDGPFAFRMQQLISTLTQSTAMDFSGHAKDVGGGYSYDEAGDIISNKTKPITGLSSHTGEVAGSVTFIVDLDDKGSGETSTPATRRRNPLPIKPGGGWANRPPVPYFKRRVGRGNDW